MQSVLPYTLNPQLMTGCAKMKILNPNSSALTGPMVTLQEPHLLGSGLLRNWDAAAASAALPTIFQSPHTWDLSWTVQEEYWEQNVERCNGPEEVESLLPIKWFGYNVHSDVDETLALVCKLCTALVDKFVSLSQGNNADVSTTKWRQRQLLHNRLASVMELLEASIGEAIPLLRLRDAEFVRGCWEQLQEEERVEIMSALNCGDATNHSNM
ncbi:hypothetical protein TRVL_02767 [Trypanosoma vivax]|uniref:Kinetoplastid kinetochore protein 6 n=1 Tax=Trypanosoma vivax (strain Y486) TaxID=1055687 RepID=G0TWE3_TRYVY|nr:hypothetical protein TRVL_02767 [Trypanosoma vivax]CCC48281.1 conserved hypothetical protein [Trypanosoma vivax Y486]